MLSLGLAAGAAWACGGTMCDGGGTTTGGTSTGGPIVQSGERIVFQQDQRGDWNAFVQILTQGAPSKFGWVIPLPNEIDPAEVTIAPDGLMDDLEAATAPQFVTDAGTLSGAGPAAPTSCGCGEGLLDGDLFEDLLIDAASEFGVAVVGTYEILMVSGDDTAALAAWVAQDGYNVPVTTWPLIDDYVSRGYSFLVVRLLPLAGGQGTVETLKIPCGQAAPAIPLMLTSIAAVSDMSVTTYVIGDQRYEPANDWPEVDLDPSTVTPDGAGGTDYVQLVQGALDGQGGRGFRTEFAAPVDLILDQLDPETIDALGEGAYVTRFQSWVSPEEMLYDPEFVPSAAGAPNVDNVIDLRSGGAAGVGLLAPLLLGVVGWARRRTR